MFATATWNTISEAFFGRAAVPTLLISMSGFSMLLVLRHTWNEALILASPLPAAFIEYASYSKTFDRLIAAMNLICMATSNLSREFNLYLTNYCARCTFIVKIFRSVTMTDNPYRL
jgi:hypothetical protein